MNSKAWALLDHYSALTFTWGVSDCFLFAAHMQDTLHGTSLYTTHKGKYHCKRSAIQYFYTHTGQRTFKNALETIWQKSTSDKVRGAVILRENACGIYLGRYSVFRSPVGVTYMPSSLQDVPLSPKKACQTP